MSEPEAAPTLEAPSDGGKLLKDIQSAAKTAGQWRRIWEGRKEHAADAKKCLDRALEKLEALAAGRETPEFQFPEPDEDELENTEA